MDRPVAVVAEAANGLSALAMFDYARLEVVLIDINLPLMDGFQATKIIISRFPMAVSSCFDE